MNVDTASRSDLEVAILEEDGLYNSLDEERFLAGGYSDDELRDAIREWILAGDECAGC